MQTVQQVNTPLRTTLQPLSFWETHNSTPQKWKIWRKIYSLWSRTLNILRRFTNFQNKRSNAFVCEHFFFFLSYQPILGNLTHCSLFFPFYTSNPSKAQAQEAPMPSKTFYGAVDPTLALKVLKQQAAQTPTLKGAFQTKHPSSTAETKKPARDKLCNGFFGCKNIATFKETSGTLFCRDHKPKNVPLETVQVEKKKSLKKK